MRKQYTDNDFGEKKDQGYVRIILFVMVVNICGFIGAGYFSFFANRPENSKTLVAPEMISVDPGELSKQYIKDVFSYVAEKKHTWTHRTIENNYFFLFKNLYSKDLTARTKTEIGIKSYFDKVRREKLVSIWEVNPLKSEYHWCSKARSQTSVRGLACGILTGDRTLYRGNKPVNNMEEISYLIYAKSKIPDKINFLRTEVTHMKAGKYLDLKSELAASLKHGTLPYKEKELKDELLYGP